MYYLILGVRSEYNELREKEIFAELEFQLAQVELCIRRTWK